MTGRITQCFWLLVPWYIRSAGFLWAVRLPGIQPRL